MSLSSLHKSSDAPGRVASGTWIVGIAAFTATRERPVLAAVEDARTMPNLPSASADLSFGRDGAGKGRGGDVGSVIDKQQWRGG